MSTDETREGVGLTNLDQELFDGAGASKRDLVDYLDAVGERMILQLRDRPLSVMRVLRGQAPFMQKNVPKYTPDWVTTVQVWAEASKRQISYALCNDRRTLLWFANQRAVEYHPTLFRVGEGDRPTHLVLDIDPPDANAFHLAVGAARLVHQALADTGMASAVKTSGAKGLHIVVPGDFTLHTAGTRLSGRDRWSDLMPEPQELSADLVAEGRLIPVARVQAMHEGKRRARARRQADENDAPGPV